MKKKKQLIVYAVVIVVLLGIIIWLVCDYSIKKKKTGLAMNWSSGAMEQTGGKLFDSGSAWVKEEVKVSTEIIEDGLRDLGKLVTQEYYFTQVENFSKEVTAAGIFTSTATIVYSYDGVVTAGVSCDEIFVDKNDTNKTITITIPKSEIQNVDIDLESFKVFEEKQGLWSKIKLADVNKSLIEFKNAAKAKALEKDVLANADKNAESIIDRFVRSLVDTGDYTVKYIHR